MANLKRDMSVGIGNTYLDGKWTLNVYLIKCNPKEDISSETITKIIEKYLLLLENSHMSQEFEYYKIGFAFLHLGNRGVDLTIWHFGRWGETFETFVCSWYCYNRDVFNMEKLDSAEPLFSQYEINTLICELKNLIYLIDYNNVEELRAKYLERSKRSINHDGARENAIRSDVQSF